MKTGTGKLIVGISLMLFQALDTVQHHFEPLSSKWLSTFDRQQALIPKHNSLLLWVMFS